MELTFWLNVLSPHQTPVLRALAKKGQVAAVVTGRLAEDRLRQGWAEPDVPNLQVIRISDPIQIPRICERQAKGHVNMVGGFRGLPMARCILKELKLRRSRTGIVTERPDTRGIGGRLRRILYSSYEKTVHNKVDFILAMGTLGERWFTNCGWPASRVFPYAYTAERPNIQPETDPTNEDEFRILYVGQNIKRKGGDILLHALKGVEHLKWSCQFVGEGDEVTPWKKLCADLAISKRVGFAPAVNMVDVPDLIRGADLLILPSRFDGWGTVVNEALMQGVPVLCSDSCGARDLLTEEWRGGVFKAGSVQSLRELLATWINRGKRTQELTDRIRDWSRCIEGEAVADYLENVMRHVYNGSPRPVAPWLHNVRTNH